MDVDFLNLTSGDSQSQMDLINMMAHLENLAELQTPTPPPPPPPPTLSPGGPPVLASNNIPFVPTGSGCHLDIYTPFAVEQAGMQEYCHSRASMAAMREMIFRVAAMQPVNIDPESVKPPKRRNVRISKDPQSVAARHRRERISERIRILQRLVPGGTKMDTASMLDEAIHYVKFLKTQVQTLERAAAGRPTVTAGFMAPGGNYPCFGNNID